MFSFQKEKQYIIMMVLWEHGSMIEKELDEIVHLDSGTPGCNRLGVCLFILFYVTSVYPWDVQSVGNDQ